MQWSSMLDLLEIVLLAMNTRGPGGIPPEYEPTGASVPAASAATPTVTFGRIDGAVAGPKRTTIIDAFNSPGSSMSVLLLTMGCGSVGITLTSATRGKFFRTHPEVSVSTSFSSLLVP